MTTEPVPTATTDAAPAAGGAVHESLPARRSWLNALSRFGFLLVFGACVAVFGVLSSSFLQLGNLLNILDGNAVLLIVALGMTLVVAAGGIDLSIGVALDFGGWLAIVGMMDYRLTWQSALLVALAAGSVVGAFNAFLVIRLGVSPFLATLGTLFIGHSIERINTSGGGQVAYYDMPQGYQNLATGHLLGIPVPVLIAAGVLVVYFVVLERSVHGRRIHALGLQPTAAEVAGVRRSRYLWFAFVFASATAAIGGIILTAELRQFTPLSGFTYLLDAIAAVFIGASMHPRQRPNVVGTLVGVLFLGVVSNGLNLIGMDFNLRAALEGIILVAALALAVAQRRLAHGWPS